MNASDQSMTSDELQALLGDRVRRIRLRQGKDQAHTAIKAGVSERALRSLELGNGSSLHTFLLVLKALGALDTLDTLLPAPRVSPMAILEGTQTRQRASSPRTNDARTTNKGE